MKSSGEEKAAERKPVQLVLDLPHRAALNAEDFLVSDCNKAAVDLIDAWPAWPHHLVLICGPLGCGKTHLANVWRAKSGADLLDSKTLNPGILGDLGPKAGVVIEDVDMDPPDEHAFFHLINMAKEQGFHILLTAKTLPGKWDVALPDLRSRLRSLAAVTIDKPDEVLLKTVLVKLFADRQLAVGPQVIDYVSLRMERSMDWICRFVDASDKLALSAGRKISRKIAASAIEELSLAKEGPVPR